MVKQHRKFNSAITFLTSVEITKGTSLFISFNLLLTLNGFALVVSTEGMIFYASATILDYLGFHQTDVMHQNVYDYIHVDDRQEFCRQLHWAMNPQQMEIAQESQTDTGEDVFLNKLFEAEESDSSPSAYSSFLNRCFICRFRCLLDSTSGFLTMQFEGKLKFLFGQKKKASSGTIHPPQMAFFCVAVPLLLPPVTEIKTKSVLMKTQKKPGATSNSENTTKPFPGAYEVEHAGRNSHQGTCFPNILHDPDNQIKLMNSGDNGISFFKVRTNEDQWVWVEANAPLRYRNGSSDYIVVPQQSEEEMKKQDGVLGLKGNREASLGINDMPALLKHHLPWGKQEKEDMKVKFQSNKCDSFLQEETSFFQKQISASQNSCPSGAWVGKTSASSRINHQLIGSFSDRINRPFYSMDQNTPGVHMLGRHHHGNTEHFQSYSGFQQHTLDSYPVEHIKLESPFVNPEVLYDSGLPLTMPIKTENDSDSEGHPELYSECHTHAWLTENNGLKKQLDFSEGLHLKMESDLSEQTSCLKPKHYMHSSHRSHCYASGTHMNHFNSGRPFKGIYNKDVGQFCPPKCAYLESVLSLQGADVSNNQFYSVATVDDKSTGNHPYKLQCEFKTHSLVQNIKREPLDSPPWVESQQEAVQAIYQKNTLMGFLPSQMPRNAAEFAYIQ
ncbi:aryl-hydrocarbon receptor repressor L homeolog isoform X1 [Xenopus laevis]|uniref:PAS domain-containing protein n=2 Tax=Xenopus laevis TaxID=8355 RepID=A0A974CN83_XENLA|nr:aryl-hydrocarbon receptor repressor L homeolog isoform X1 [Xenopus laevis]OCT76168.1 hypothetical protein XELAEV_18031360mg [Xenopus laevis]